MIQDLSPEDLEQSALSAVIDNWSTFKDAREAGVDEMSFQVEENIKVWEYLVECHERAVKPTAADVLKVTGVLLDFNTQDAHVYFVELGRQSVVRRVRQAVIARLEGLGLDSENDPVKAVRSLVGDLGDILHVDDGGHERYFDADVEARLAEIEEKIARAEDGQVIGLPTGLQLFDSVGDTWKKGELIAIIGALNVGKSWLLLKFAEHAYWHADARVLFLSPESTVADVDARLDPMVARELGFELSNRAIRNGTLDMDTYRKYVAKLVEHGRKAWVTRDAGDSGVFTVEDIIALAREHRPDLLAIDGFHLIRGEGSSWESMKRAAEAIKGIAQEQGMVVIVGSQAQRQAVMAPDQAPRAGEAAYGLALMEAANRVISLAIVRGHKDQRIFQLPKHRDGEINLDRNYLLYNVDVGEIRQLNVDADISTGMVTFD